MDYTLAIEGTPETTIEGGTSLLLLHPSTGETDRIDTDFLKTDTDYFLVVSTRTTAREVMQKLDYYDVDEDRATILDTLSVERGYSRRSGDDVHYVSRPEDLDGIVQKTADFLTDTEGKRRVSVDSITELAYYAGEEETREAVGRIMDLLEEHDAVGLFHLSDEVHDDSVVETYREMFDGVIDLHEDDSLELAFE
jgi:KaiC/GvpD/RAD55 family RecA-like ATPase